jgi:hypothetical protein
MKYTANLSAATANGRGQNEFPSDQLIRNIRIGLWRTGSFERASLFEEHPRDFAVIVISPTGVVDLVNRYRDPAHLLKSLPCSDKLRRLPRLDFIGGLSYADIVDILRKALTRVTRPEQILIDDLCKYLEFKLSRATGNNGSSPSR